MGSYTLDLSTSSHILKKHSCQNKSIKGKALIFLMKNSSRDYSFFAIFLASVTLVTWLSKYFKYFFFKNGFAYCVYMTTYRFTCNFEIYNKSKYSIKLFTSTQASEDLIGLALCPGSLGLLKFINFFTITSEIVQLPHNFNLL